MPPLIWQGMLNLLVRKRIIQRLQLLWRGAEGTPSCSLLSSVPWLARSHWEPPGRAEAVIPFSRSWSDSGQGKAENSHLTFLLSSALQSCPVTLVSLKEFSHGFLQSSHPQDLLTKVVQLWNPSYRYYFITGVLKYPC